MRHSLRSQILYPILGVMLVATGCASATTAWLAARRTQHQIEVQLRNVAAMLSAPAFPITDKVLHQARELSGVELVLVEGNGKIEAASLPGLSPIVDEQALQKPSNLKLGKIVQFRGQSYFHVAVAQDRRRAPSAGKQLHLYYPEAQWRQAWRESVAPPLLVGAAAMACMGVITTWLAARLTRPIVRLQLQVERMSQGDFAPLPLPDRNDEIRDLAASVNRMAEMLARYEEEVRRRERLRTLGQLGGGIAHQMRNAATGCRMALDLHRRELANSSHDEYLDVATRQLELMETYLRRFLTLGAEHAPPSAALDWGKIVEDVLPLIRPMASHLGVELSWAPPSERLWICGDETGLAQLVVNLTLNAIEAAARRPAPAVEVRLADDGPESVLARLEIIDNGPGPAEAVRNSLFEPLVSDKPDGAGLGLPVAREIARLHGGDIRWERRAGRTHFVVEIPLLPKEAPRAAIVGS